MYGFDYRRPASPRLVTLATFSSQLEANLQTFAFYESDLLIGGYPGAIPALPILQTDASQPRNVINPGYTPFALAQTPTASQPSVAGHSESESNRRIPRKLRLGR